MSSINPFSGYVAQGALVERTQASDKSRQVRQTAEVAKMLATRDDEMEHLVENTDEIAAIHDDKGSHQQQQPRDKDGKPEKEEPHLDIKA